MLLKPDPTFYPSAKLAMQAPAEGLAYVAAVQRNGQPDALRVVDLDPHSPTYGQCATDATQASPPSLFGLRPLTRFSAAISSVIAPRRIFPALTWDSIL